MLCRAWRKGTSGSPRASSLRCTHGVPRAAEKMGIGNGIGARACVQYDRSDQRYMASDPRSAE
eukprot:7383671-Prymnesium_polylepis.1